MKYIERIKLHNFKRFRDHSIAFDSKLNLLVGDNEAGKSTILNAINLVLSGSRFSIDSAGLDSIFNVDVVQEFLDSPTKKAEELPVLYVELFLNDFGEFNLNGKNNSEGVELDGLRLECDPNPDYSEAIKEVLESGERHFPFEYYRITFKTFYGASYSPYNKFLRHLMIDSSQTSDEYAIRGYVKDMYNTHVEVLEKHTHLFQYRKHKADYRDIVLQDLNDRLEGYSFSLRNNSKANLETDLTLMENNVALEDKGSGKRNIVKTEFAIKKGKKNLDVLLLEEPENHLSHTNMVKLISAIRSSKEKQLFITTHSSLVAARLDLRNTILFSSNSIQPFPIKELSDSTARFFMKAPDSNILEFVLSEKVLLVEGNSEYILMKSFFENLLGIPLESSGIHIISVGGTSFRQYMEIAKMLGIKTAVVRDNDGDYQKNCIDLYADHVNDHIKVFGEKDTDNLPTLEHCVYTENQEACHTLFEPGRRTLSVLEYMLQNKADTAFELVDKKAGELVPPDYIKEAILWLNE